MPLKVKAPTGVTEAVDLKVNTNPQVQRLTEWFLSPQGQELVKDVGYVPK